MPAKPRQYRPPGHAAAKAAARRAYEAQPDRAESQAFYRSPRWRALRALVLAEHPLCFECEKAGRSVPAKHAHHQKARAEFPELELEATNIIGLCHSCHSRVTRQEQGRRT